MRSYSRFESDQEIQLTVVDTTMSVRLYNLGCGGCMIETGAADVAEGSPVVIGLGGKAKVAGRVAWRSGKNAGVKFDTPLHQKMVEKFGYVPVEEFDREDPRDRFGLPLLG